jgi:hypothetical protein
MGPAEMSSKQQQFNVVEVLDNNGANWPLWHSKMLLIFESKGLLPHIEGKAKLPVLNSALAALQQPSDEEQEKIDKFEERIEKFQSKEGLAKAQIVTSVSESLALMLNKHKTAKDMWDGLIVEMTKKPKMVLTTLQ